ncbi:MAG: hypothetical protein SFV15_07640 [Polyangiaceae bacterium]|nr:hypothetical protein [Polyangiaceae bacterium]
MSDWIGSWSLVLAALGVLGSCSSEPRDLEPSAARTGALVGTFLIDLHAATGTNVAYTGISGAVLDGPSPSAVVWDLVAEKGACALRKPRAPFCNPGCGSGHLCVETNQCQSFPIAQDVGEVVLAGLGTGPLSLVAVAGRYSAPPGLTLDFPPAREGAPVELVVAQSLYGMFSIKSSMVAPLVSAGPVALEPGQPLMLSWEPPMSATPAHRIEVKLDISHHGGSKGAVECDAADTGNLEIDADLISQLVALGVAGFPSISLKRVSSGSTEIAPGTVRLRVESGVVRDVALPGVVSCHETADCPGGRVCQGNLTCAP